MIIYESHFSQIHRPAKEKLNSRVKIQAMKLSLELTYYKI